MLSRRLAIAGAVVVFVVAYAYTQAYGNHYLRSIDRRESHIIVLNRRANAALDELEPKVHRLRPTNAKAGTMVASLHATNRTLGRMERSVASLNRRIRALSRALGTTQTALAGVSGSVGSTVSGIQSVNGGLGATASAVDGIAGDVGATRGVLASFPAQLAATNDRLDYINRIVGRLGDAGITSNIVLTIRINGSKVGTATIRATILPRETWRLP
jgi:hypothetical protein